MGNYCEHGVSKGKCAVCWQPRTIENLYDAWKVLRSGFGSHLEWCSAAELFYKNGLEYEAETCSLKAIYALGGLPGKQSISWKMVLGIYIRGRLAKDSVSVGGRVNFNKLADRLGDVQSSIRAIRAQRLASNKSTSMLSEADVALAESIMLARDSSRYSRVQLAAKFRRASKHDLKFRWGRPEIAVSLMDDYLSRHPDDSAALCVKASALADLACWDEATKVALIAVAVKPDNSVALITAGRTYIGLGDGLKAWDYVFQSFAMKQNLPTVAMLAICCAIATTQPQLSPAQRHLINQRRSYVMSIIDRMPKTDNSSGIANLNRLTIKALIFDGFYAEAIKFLEEVIQDGYEINVDYWQAEINKAITLSGKSIADVRAHAAAIHQDLFPDAPPKDG